jgi:hypothetical protein
VNRTFHLFNKPITLGYPRQRDAGVLELIVETRSLIIYCFPLPVRLQLWRMNGAAGRKTECKEIESSVTYPGESVRIAL